ncbi:MAG TPA: cytochrome c [Candidatus Bathyarchaeia archaeon]|nr:cytochrome c [Candidatus Bathyarchaeia archaeon]
MNKLMPFVVLAAVIVLVLCAQGRGPAAQDPTDKGIGPVKELKLGPVDEKLAARGKELFDSRCAACHGLDKALAGPALGSVLKTRAPEFVMNMILNTEEMGAKNPTVKKLTAQYGMPMPAPGLSQDEARAVVEYLRTTK